ncbi:hypothetical protein MSAN_00069100 [Mycena sanguinolenta]|uniref:DUF3669 domain-containing protein n=1 Tax=Mycena sanguinolenta TaxID=230812 RepID=A0A8H6ZGM8_9AGAR|nr:hypothetical protein MSAN_00069100 [Mycena sanguinolenta]
MSKISEPQLLVVGRGSFGEVQLLSQTSLAFKSVLNPSEDTILEKEWNTMLGICSSCNVDSTSFFSIPRPLGLFLPAASDPRVQLAPPGPPLEVRGRIKRRPQIPEILFRDHEFKVATYAMTFIANVPASIGKFVANNFYPDSVLGKGLPSPNLIRLYFGRDGPERSQSRFVNTQNFPTNVTQYTSLHRAMEEDGVADPHDVVRGMGEMLGKLHWKYGCDARDVEFVLGEGANGEVEYWLLDFNQTRPFDTEAGDIDELTQAHFSNDPYFPFARASNPLFSEFRRGYEEILSAQTSHIRARGQDFLQKLIAVQTDRDQSAKY